MGYDIRDYLDIVGIVRSGARIFAASRHWAVGTLQRVVFLLRVRHGDCHSAAFMPVLSSGLLPAGGAQALRRRLVVSVAGGWLGTVVTVFAAFFRIERFLQLSHLLRQFRNRGV